MAKRNALYAAVVLSFVATAFAQTITGSGTKGYIPKFTGTTTQTNSRIFQNSTGVGINTTSPAATLDVNGTLNAASVTATTVNTVNPTGGVNSTLSGSGNSIAAVEGSATMTGAAGFTFGVIGQSASDQGRGVFGLASGATGVGVIGESSGTSGIGVVGKDLSGGGLGFYSQGHAAQNRTGGGWVKALMYVNTRQAPYTILNCFNSTLTGAAATTPPCGFTLTELGPANFTIDIGFEVDDRFISATVNGSPSAPSVLVAPNNHTLNIIWYDLFAGGIAGEYYWVAIY